MWRSYLESAFNVDKILNSSTLPILLIPMFVATLVVESNVNDECRFLTIFGAKTALLVLYLGTLQLRGHSK